ncbi:MAG: hypothetical protein KUG61_04470 [Parvibaculaceae bacterium]|nr:hypothetical protein [Parvibaculaceae bacterium]
MHGLSLGVGLSSRFAAWWGIWRLALNFPMGRYHLKGEAGLVLTETRTSSAWVQKADGTYKEVAVGEFTRGQFSQAVTNYVSASDMTGAVAGVPGVYPTGWTGITNASGVQREIVGVGERNGLPTIKLRFYGQWDAGHPGYTNVSLGAISAMPVTEAGKISQGMHVALVAGSLGPVDSMNLNAYFRLANAYKGQTSAYIKTSITTAFQRLGAIDTALSPIGSTCDAAEMALFFHVDPETPFDFTLEIGAPYFSPVGFVPPVNIGPGGTVTRDADNPVVVQGMGVELLSDGATPHAWLSSGATLTDNIDGSTTIASTGDTWSRAYNPAIGWEQGVTKRGRVMYKAGSSSVAKVLIRNSTTSTESHLSGPIGALVATNTGAGVLTIISQTLSGDEYTIEYDFVPNSATSDLGYVGFGPNTTAVGETVVVVSASLRQVLPYPGYDISIKEDEPSVVFEVKAKWGATIGQHAFRFDEGASANIILAQQTGLGTIKLLVRVAGVDVINFASAVLWPSDTEATFRLEITKTDAGTFFALFLDGVYIDDIPAGPVDYPDAINQLKLAPVEGVSVIKQVHGK